MTTVVSDMRLNRLREVSGRALEASLAGCSVDEFCDGFAVDPQHRPALEHAYKEAVAEMRGNVLAECDLIYRELGVGDSLHRLDTLVAEQPELPDGSRCLHVAPEEAGAMVSQATLSVKQKHRLVLQRALQQVRDENADLKQQYLAHHAQLVAASSQIDSVKASLEGSAMECERFCMAN